MFKKLSVFMLLCMVAVAAFAQQKTTRYTRDAKTLDNGLAAYIDPQLFPFYHGVASGDPLQDRVVLWTRVTPENDREVTVTWQMATDPQMRNVVKQGTLTTSRNQDYTVKVDPTGLEAGTTYYYQFSALGRNSLVGRTRTAPRSTDNLKFAVVSCSNYQDGFFGAYRKIGENNNLDAVIHLGDYIYEYKDGGFGNERPIEPKNEIITLEDYRVRYSFYRLDKDLRAAHQQHPFITVWDDHEFANNAYKDGAENHQSNEGDWETRKNNAWKAYFEWMPVRSNTDPSQPFRIYRKINYGDLVDILMLDTRIEARDKQDDSLLGLMEKAGRALETVQTESRNQKVDQAPAVRKVLAEYLPLFLNTKYNTKANLKEGHILTGDELNFILDELARYAAVLEEKPELAKNNDHSPELEKVLQLIQKSVKHNVKEAANNRAQASKQLLGAEQFAWLENELVNSTAKWRILGNQVLLAPVNALSLSDTWDGYEEERTRLFNFIKNNNINNVAVVTGDIHTTFANDLPDNTFLYGLGVRNSVGVEFVTPSVTSSNLDDFAGIGDGFLSFLLRTFNSHVKESNLTDHGYMVLDVNNNRIQSDWYYINDISNPNSGQFFGQGWLVRDNEQRLRSASSPAAASPMASRPLAPANPINTPAMVQNRNAVLFTAYPNPVQDVCGVNYVLTKDQHVTAAIYSMDGKLEMEILDEKKSAGNYLTRFNTAQLPNGTYIFKLKTAEQTSTRTLIVRH